MDEIQVEIYGEPKSKAGNSKKNANGKRTLTDAVVKSNVRNQWVKMLIAKGAVSLHFKITELLELLSSCDTVLF
jgi:hypothetical protein